MTQRNACDALFATESGERIRQQVLSLIREENMAPQLARGVLIGLSGGADSVLLLHVLADYARREGIALLAVHVHHGIRGEEADRDERFSAGMAESLGVPFLSCHIDVPAVSAATGRGIEEVARELRYAEFDKILSGRDDISTIATAHNATDNVETVLQHLLRGSAVHGMTGIPPVRGHVLRPLLHTPRSLIEQALSEAGIPYVTDTTNGDTGYRRNYIRHEVLPLLRQLNPRLEAAVQRLTVAARIDDGCLSQATADYLAAEADPCRPNRARLLAAHPAIATRVILSMADAAGLAPEEQHVRRLLTALRDSPPGAPVSLSVPGGRLMAEGAHLFAEGAAPATFGGMLPLPMGETILAEQGIAVLLSHDPNERLSVHNFSSNVYTFSIQKKVGSAIITDGLFLRTRRAGDAYRYGGMTHTVKKLFNDKKIPPHKRALVPVFSDARGIVWIPGFGVREDGDAAHDAPALFITLAVTEHGVPQDGEPYRGVYMHIQEQKGNSKKERLGE